MFFRWAAYSTPTLGGQKVIKGIGVDTVQVDRIAKSLTKPGFAEKVFCKEERELFSPLGEKHKAESAAACFAAKEAFLKGLGVGLGSYAFQEIAALRKPSGQPYFVLRGKAAEDIERMQLVVHLSLTHEGGFATAFVVVEERQC